MLLRKNNLVLFLFIFFTEVSYQCTDVISTPVSIYIQMADFTPIFKETLNWEGGFQNYESKANYNSRGELIGTNRGISAIAYEQYIGHPPTVAEIKAITPEISEAVYRKLFWNKIRGNDIQDQDVAAIIFATYIGNPAKSNQIVAAALKDVGHEVGIVKTTYSDEVVKAINRSNPAKLFYAIKEEKRKFLESLRASYPQFINGWMRKLNSFEYGGSKKKIIWISLAAIVLIAGGYYAYRKGWHKVALQKIKSLKK
jgi:lysozyme family protein